MKVKEIMTPDPVACSSRDNLATAAMRMWNRDCGVLPVVDHGRVQGVVTDRDICMALFLKGGRPSEITVAEVIHGKVHSCSPEDDVSGALALMRENGVRRLPVIEDGALRGMLSINDVVLTAGEAAAGDPQRPAYPELLATLQALCAHRPMATATA